MDRLGVMKNQLATKNSYVDNSIEFLKFNESFLTPEEEQIRKDFRAYLEKEIAPIINEYYEKAEMPAIITQKLKEYKILDYLLKKPFGNGKLSATAQGVMLAEMTRIDLGLGTYILVLTGLVGHTIEALASEEQKQKWLPRLRDFEIQGGWGLTEEKLGSDASSLETTVKKVQGGYILNGDKRWIGNGNKDFVLVWARDVDTKKIGCYFVENKSAGFSSNAIKNKLAIRLVQNCQMRFNNVFVPEENKLPKATDFQKSTAKILLHSRVFVCWLTCGIAQGVYDNISKYIQERKQFGVPIASFQLQQEKLTRIMSNTQAILLTCQRLSVLLEKGSCTIGMAAMGKAWITERTREVARLGREMMGGNGIIIDNYVIKAVVDAEVTYTYEGTYDINSLVAGRELTGIAAFKVPKKQ